MKDVAIERVKMRVGITGSTGFLGKILCKKLSEIKYCFSAFEGDVRNKEDLRRWIKEGDFDSIIHLAAVVPTSQVNKDPLRAYEVNVGGVLNLLSELQKQNKKVWLFFSSSSHVYKSSESKISEDDEIEPVSQYGWTKYIGEKICTDFSKSEDCKFPICCGRIFSFYHKSQKPPFLYPSILKRLKEEDLDKPFFLYGADSERDFLNAEEVVDIIIKLMKNKSEGIINIASGKGTKIREFVQNLSSKKLEIITDDNVPNRLIADTSKLKEIIFK